MWVLRRVIIQEDGQSSQERGKVMVETLCRATKELARPLVTKTFISVNDRWSRTYVTEALGAASYW